MIRAGIVQEIRRESGDWAFVDMGFAAQKKSCGLIVGTDPAKNLSFGGLVKDLTGLARSKPYPLNIVIEAPLSVAFTAQGNPCGRSFEKRGRNTRYWYVGLGCAVLVATMHLLRAMELAGPSRQIRLFEGFVLFKDKALKSHHASDIEALRDVAWNPDKHRQAIFPADQLAASPTDTISSAFEVMGLDYGIPPVLAAGA